MQADENRQATKSSWYASVNPQKKVIQIEVNDSITYTGQVPIIQGMSSEKFIEKIQKQEGKVLTKTTAKMEIEFGFFVVTLLSKESLEFMKLNAKIQELENKLQDNLVSNWQNMDLDSQEQFSADYTYKIKESNGQSYIAVTVHPNNLYFFHSNGTRYNIKYSSKRQSGSGNTVTQIKRMKV